MLYSNTKNMAKIKYVYWEDDIGGKKCVLETVAYRYGYSVGPHGQWEMLIAREDKDVQKDQTVTIKIEEVEIPPKSIVLACLTLRHALGVVLTADAMGKPKGVETRRVLDEVVFLPIHDGTVHKGELLTVVNVFHATPERRFARGAAEKWLQERYRY
ncbi:MAG TPA: DUF22 domain-containing protein [Methanomicrobia archaeon]|nr:DUF22 domain-containing protein [Methanomicrobia archaeon]